MRKALISVFDKTGIVEFAKSLHSLGWEIISTGGTSRTLKEEGIPVVDIADLTKFPECFDGRVKTLHPNVEGGILSVRDNENHKKQMCELGIEPIDMVVCNSSCLRSGVSRLRAITRRASPPRASARQSVSRETIHYLITHHLACDDEWAT